MQHTTMQSARPSARTNALALVAGFAVLLLLFPASGIGDSVTTVDCEE